MVFQNAISKAEVKESEEVADRVNKLIDCITYSVFQYTTRGLFECDKLIFSSQMAFQVFNALQLKMCKNSSNLLFADFIDFGRNNDNGIGFSFEISN